jgi:uncharacterized protein (UPF0371 family)
MTIIPLWPWRSKLSGLFEPYGFDSALYTDVQVGYIRSRIRDSPAGPTYLEFGGKPFGDFHASRVLPGYEANCKAEILNRIGVTAKVVMVVNVRDVLPAPAGRYPHGRIRGDSSLRYSDETVRLVLESRQFNIPIDCVVLSVMPAELRADDAGLIAQFESKLRWHGIPLRRHYAVPDYPDPAVMARAAEVFGRNDVLAEPGRHLVVFSPGGGSGKFGVILSELYHSLSRGERPNFLKFETFPVFRLPQDHALNLAFEAATADLDNKVVGLAQGVTTYDKDIENFRLLRELYEMFGVGSDHPVSGMVHPTDMGVNVVDRAITNMGRVAEACGAEIARRYTRYVLELAEGDEYKSTVDRVREILRTFATKYPGLLPGEVLPF